MRRKFLLQSILWATVVFLFSCQKEVEKKSDDSQLISKINSWLDKQKSPTQPNKASNIDLLKENIDFSAMKFEVLNQNEQFIVIPIKENYKIKKNIDANTSTVLLLVRDRTGNILRGNLVLYIPEKNEQMNTVPANTFSKMYSEKSLECSGLFRFLSPTGTWLYQREYKDGKLKSFGYVKADNTYQGRTSNDCTYYVLNLYLWYDGVLIAQETILLGMSCPRACDDPNNQSLCPDNGGGGGGGSGGGDGQVQETCCIADPNVQFTHQLTTLGSDLCGLEGINPATGNPIKTCTHSWTFDKWRLLWYSWDFTSFTKTDLEKEAGLWKFRTVAFQSVARSGQLPPCVSSDCTVNSANTSISADQFRAKLVLTYTIANRLSCYEWWTPNNVVSTIAKDWPPPY